MSAPFIPNDPLLYALPGLIKQMCNDLLYYPARKKTMFNSLVASLDNMLIEQDFAIVPPSIETPYLSTTAFNNWLREALKEAKAQDRFEFEVSGNDTPVFERDGFDSFKAQCLLTIADYQLEISVEFKHNQYDGRCEEFVSVRLGQGTDELLDLDEYFLNENSSSPSELTIDELVAMHLMSWYFQNFAHKDDDLGDPNKPDRRALRDYVIKSKAILAIHEEIT